MPQFVDEKNYPSYRQLQGKLNWVLGKGNEPEEEISGPPDNPDDDGDKEDYHDPTLKYFGHLKIVICHLGLLLGGR